MAIQSRFAVLLTLSLLATSGLAIPVNPQVNAAEAVGQNRVSALGTPVHVPRGVLPHTPKLPSHAASPSNAPFPASNPDALPLVPFVPGKSSKRAPKYSEDADVKSPLKAVDIESDHNGKKAPITARKSNGLPDVHKSGLPVRADDTTFDFTAPLHALDGQTHSYSDTKREDEALLETRATDETMDTTVPLNALHITDHKYHGRDVEARKTDTTSHFNAPLNAAEVQDHKYQQERRGHSKLPVEVPKTPKAPKAPKVARKHHHSKLPVESPKAPKVARKHDQTTHVDSILGTSMDYHPYKDNRRDGQLSARKHDQTTHLDTLLGGKLDYHPYTDSKKRVEDHTMTGKTAFNGEADYHKYSDEPEQKGPEAPKAPKAPKAARSDPLDSKASAQHNGKSESVNVPPSEKNVKNAPKAAESVPKTATDTVHVKRETPEWVDQ